MPNKTSRSPDGIPALFLKLVSINACRVRNHCHDNCLCVPLSKLFNVIMQLGDVPDIWCTAEVVPVYKKGDASDPGNYRPVSLTCITCKVMERVVKNELMSFLLKFNVITKEQHGFLSRRSLRLSCWNV